MAPLGDNELKNKPLKISEEIYTLKLEWKWQV